MEVVGADVVCAGIRRGGNIPNLAVGKIVPGAILLNSNMEPKRTCCTTGNLASNYGNKRNFIEVVKKLRIIFSKIVENVLHFIASMYNNVALI